MVNSKNFAGTLVLCTLIDTAFGQVIDQEAKTLVGWDDTRTGAGATIALIERPRINASGQFVGLEGCLDPQYDPDPQIENRFPPVPSLGQGRPWGCNIDTDDMEFWINTTFTDPKDIQDQQDCEARAETAITAWVAELGDVNPTMSGEQLYVFQDVHDSQDPPSQPNLLDKVVTVARLSGQVKGPVVNQTLYPNTISSTSYDSDGWVPDEVSSGSCPVKQVLCAVDEPLFSNLPNADLQALGASEGSCRALTLGANPNGEAAAEHIQLFAPDSEFIFVGLGASRRAREDYMSAALQWVIDNHYSYDIDIVRYGNAIFSETALMTQDLKDFCGGYDSKWCLVSTDQLYTESCSASNANKDYAFLAQTSRPIAYEPVAAQFERLLNEGVVSVKGVGHEGWKSGVPYPECSDGLLPTAGVYSGAHPVGQLPARYAPWIAHSFTCRDLTTNPDQVACYTNNSIDVGMKLTDGNNTAVGPIFAPSWRESESTEFALASSTAQTSELITGTLAVLKGDDLGFYFTGHELVDLLYETGATVTDNRICEPSPSSDNPTLTGTDSNWYRPELADLSYWGGTEPDGVDDLLQFPWGVICDDTNPDHFLDIVEGGSYDGKRVNVSGAIANILPQRVEAEISVSTDNPGNVIHPHHDGEVFNPNPLPDDVISVLIYGASTDPAHGDPIDLAAADINVATLAFGPARGGIDPASTPIDNVDVDGDGLNDLQAEFLTSNTFNFDIEMDTVGCNADEVSIIGDTNYGDGFYGVDDSIVVDCDAVCHW